MLVHHPDTSLPWHLQALRGLIVALYTQFVPVRHGIRQAIKGATLEAVQQCRRVNPRVMGVRLHALDGGAKSAELSLEGAVALLEILGAIIRGFMRPLARKHHALLWECLIPMHSTTAMVDDVNPVLSLYHRSLMQCIGPLIERDPSLVATVSEQMIQIWPSAENSNSSMEVPFAP